MNRAELAYKEEDVLYSAGCPMIKARIEGVPIKALLDSGAEICVMGLDLARRAGLPYQSHSKLSMLGVTGKSTAFKGVCKSVDVEVGGVIIDVPIFVLDSSDFDLILGRPFQRQGQVQITDLADGSCKAVVRAVDDSKEVRFQAALPRNPADKGAAAVFSMRGLKE